MYKIVHICLIIILGVICVFDIKRKKIPVYMLIILAAAGIISNFTIGEFDIEKRIIAMLPGMILLIVSMITKQQIGYGDGLIILIMGLYIDIDDILSIVLSSFLLSSIAAIILMTVFKKKKNFEMAFSPFLLIGYGLVKGVYFICG
nr:prepilin peptidase [uncultured Agathobacter sp.]